MGLFDRLTGKGRKDSGGGGNSFLDYTGMRVEIYDEEGTILFVARFSASGGGVVLLQQISKASREIPGGEGVEPLPVRLRGYHEAQKVAIHIQGKLSWVSDQIWRLEDAKITGKENERSSFRQGIETTGIITRPGEDPATEGVKCDFVNISIGGVCFRTTTLFAHEEELYLQARLMPEQAVFPLHCVVRRVSALRGGRLEYGCQFVNLGPAVEERLAKSIMELQMQRLKR